MKNLQKTSLYSVFLFLMIVTMSIVPVLTSYGKSIEENNKNNASASSYNCMQVPEGSITIDGRLDEPCCTNVTKKVKKGWRVAWLGGHKYKEKVLQAAKELNFDAVVVYWDKEKTVDFIKLARSYGLDTYTWIFPMFPDGNKNKYKQQM